MVAWQRFEDGKYPAVGNTVDLKTVTYTNSIGAPYLETYRRDPDFKANQRAVYYVRVIEIPTPNWLAFDVKFFGVKLPHAANLIHQERAYTSPVWYTP